MESPPPAGQPGRHTRNAQRADRVPHPDVADGHWIEGMRGTKSLRRLPIWMLGGAAEQIHAALARSPDGLTRTQIRDLCQRNLPANRVEQALHALAATGRAQQQRTLTGGRPAELWTATPAPSV